MTITDSSGGLIRSCGALVNRSLFDGYLAFSLATLGNLFSKSLMKVVRLSRAVRACACVGCLSLHFISCIPAQRMGVKACADRQVIECMPVDRPGT